MPQAIQSNANTDWTSSIQPAYDKQGEPNFLTKDGILVEGIYSEVPNDVYHSLPAVSSTGLKTAQKSLAHYYRQYKSDVVRTLTTQQVKTFDTGSLGHELILEPDNFYQRWVKDLDKKDFENQDICFTAAQIKQYLKKHNLKTSGTKAELVQRCLEYDSECPVWDVMLSKHHLKHQNKTIVDPVVWDDAHRIQKSHLEHPYANTIIQKGYAELTMIARCPETGLMLKVKFDYIRPNGIAADVKTSRSASPEKFARQCGELHYDTQQVFYTYVAALCGVDIHAFVFIVIEYQEADICEVMEISSRRIEIAKKRFMASLHELAEAEKKDVWTGYNKKRDITVIDIPDYL